MYILQPMKWEGLIEEITELWKKQTILGMGEEDAGKCISTSEARFKGVNLAPKGEGGSVADEWDVVPSAARLVLRFLWGGSSPRLQAGCMVFHLFHIKC